MRYTITKLDCQLNMIIDYYDTDDMDEAEHAYTRMKNDADRLRYTSVFFFDRDMGEFLSEEF